MSKSIRTALDRLCSDRELIKKSYAELEELERKSTAFDNAKEDLELAQAVKLALEDYFFEGYQTDRQMHLVSELVQWYREQKESTIMIKRYKIDSVYDLNGNPKEQRIWGSVRNIIPWYSDKEPCIVTLPVQLAYAGGYGVRRTSSLVAYHEDDEGIILVTLNSVYVLKVTE